MVQTIGKIYIKFLYGLYVYIVLLYVVFIIDAYEVRGNLLDFIISGYLNAALVLIGGFVIGIILLTNESNFHKNMGTVFIIANILVDAVVIGKAMV